MSDSRSCRTVLLRIAVLFLLAAVLCIVPVAAVDYSVSQYSANIPAGGAISYAILVSNPGSGDPVDLLIDVKGIGQGADLQYTMVEPIKDTYTYSARKFVTVGNSTLHLDPGNKKQVIVTTELPSDVRNGGRYAMLVFHTLPGKNVTESDHSIPVLLSVLGTSTDSSGSIASIDAPDAVSGQQAVVTTSYKNTGNIHQSGLVDTITITGPDGNTVVTNTSGALPLALLPGKSYSFAVPVSTAGLAPGTYTIVSRVAAEGNTFMDKKAVSFVVTPGTTTAAPAATTKPTASAAPTQTKSPLPPVIAIGSIAGALLLAAEMKRRQN